MARRKKKTPKPISEDVALTLTGWELRHAHHVALLSQRFRDVDASIKNRVAEMPHDRLIYAVSFYWALALANLQAIIGNAAKADAFLNGGITPDRLAYLWEWSGSQPGHEQRLPRFYRLIRAFLTWQHLYGELWRRAKANRVTIQCACCAITVKNFDALAHHVSCAHPDLWRMLMQYQHDHTELLIRLKMALGLETSRAKERYKGIAHRSGLDSGLAFLSALDRGASYEQAILEGLMADLWTRGEIEREHKAQTAHLTPLAKVTALESHMRIVTDIQADHASIWRTLPQPLRMIASNMLTLWLPVLDGRLGSLADNVVAMSVRTTWWMKHSLPQDAIVKRLALTPAQWVRSANDLDKLIEAAGDTREKQRHFSLKIAFDNERQARELTDTAAEMDGPGTVTIVNLYGEGMTKADIHRQTAISRPTIDARLDRVARIARELQKNLAKP